MIPAPDFAVDVVDHFAGALGMQLPVHALHRHADDVAVVQLGTVALGAQLQPEAAGFARSCKDDDEGVISACENKPEEICIPARCLRQPRRGCRIRWSSRMPEIFISSSNGTSSLALRLAKDLEKQGFHTFLPTRDLQGGADYPQIFERVSRSDAFLVLVDSNPKRSTTQEREWFAVLNEASDLTKNKKLIPLVLGEGEPPNFLKNWQELRVREPDDSKRWHKLVDTIATALRSPDKPKFKALRKTDLERRERRLESIAATAKQLRLLGS
ncbi:MAG TPA: toll/interleukin-1 receptor domain-containing protein [Candidatus Acidoferrales bacterium]|nr:toll/interleukin-1 receptor domain-containing protein [Candidatus Acidoferrales bacterium]